MCDASAAVALDADHFVVANDERNTLRIYKRGQPDPVKSVELSGFLGTNEKKESDLEGAARIGTRVYWISSHGRNKDGELQERRRRFFATEITSEAGIPTVTPVGNAPYKELLADLAAAQQLAVYDLAKASEKAPEAAGGLNIEGLAAMPDGKLLIGFRNPIPGNKALIVPLENPDDVVGARRLGSEIRFKLTLAAEASEALNTSATVISSSAALLPIAAPSSFTAGRDLPATRRTRFKELISTSCVRRRY